VPAIVNMQASLPSRTPTAVQLCNASRFVLPPIKMPDFQIGTLVWCAYADEKWFPGSTLATRAKGFYDISFDTGFTESNVPRLRLEKFTPVREGDRVSGCYQDDLEECYLGTVGRVHPSDDHL
jgi:hypothetical protein